MLAFYNSESDRFEAAAVDGSVSRSAESARSFVDLDPSRFSWDSADFSRLSKGHPIRDLGECLQDEPVPAFLQTAGRVP